MTEDGRQKLRQYCQQQRHELSPDERLFAANAVTKLFVKTPLFTTSQKFAFYIANKGEIDPHPILQFALDAGKQCYLPVLHLNKPGHLNYVAYQNADLLKKNKFGIQEPHETADNVIEPSHLDLVFVPLVAFDKQGNRLGMGKGYYDKTFEFRLNESQKKPLLIGLAYEFQRVDVIEQKEWDVPLDAVITEKQIFTWRVPNELLAN